jgi:hypothetical protein
LPDRECTSAAVAHRCGDPLVRGRCAAAELAEARRLSRDGRFSSIAPLKAAQYFGAPAVRALYKATYLVGLREAGMPEE